MSKFFALAATLAVAAAKEQHCINGCRTGENTESIMYMRNSMAMKQAEWDQCEADGRCPVERPAQAGAVTQCVNGMAGEYPCSGVDMLSFIPLTDLRPRDASGNPVRGNSNDIWGWIDPLTQREYAIICLVEGTSFVDVSDPVNPTVMGYVRDTNRRSASWRDAKVFDNHVFIGSETADHGMQVFDLRRLRTLTGVRPGEPVAELQYDALYNEFGSSHNIVLNEDTGVVYAVGTRTCRGGLHMVDVNEPTNPRFLGCFDRDGYTHDAECVTYDGPDQNYQGREICFNYNEDTLTIVDVTVKSAPVQLSRVGYNLSQYTHQGWLTGDKRHLLMNDELDEQNGPNKNTRTLIWNVDDLTAPKLAGNFYAPVTSIDHNLYIRNDIGYLSNYSSGLRVMNATIQYDETKPQGEQAEISQLGFFDVCPDSSRVEFRGTWSNFPYYAKEGVVAVSSIERGLFMLQVNTL